MTVMNKKIVVIGGGHGQSAICRGIKYIENVDISAIVTVADDGGSTGRLRRQFHIPAMGDIRNVMIALAGSETVLSNLMDYRFDDPDGSEEDVHGHNLGNLILTALTQQSGSFLEAVRTIEQVLNVKGKIIPATTQVITLFALMEDDVIVKGEANIPTVSNRIRKVFYEEPVKASREAVDAILEADLIIYGIGSVFTSILPNVIIPELTEALQDDQNRSIDFLGVLYSRVMEGQDSSEEALNALQSVTKILQSSESDLQKKTDEIAGFLKTDAAEKTALLAELKAWLQQTNQENSRRLDRIWEAPPTMLNSV